MGRIAADITAARRSDDSRENRLGNLIADAQLADTDDGRPRRRGGRADEPGRRARRPDLRASGRARRRDRHLRGGVHRPAVQQPRRHPDVHGRRSCSTCSRTSGAARTERRRCCCRRARSTTRTTSRSPTSILGDAVRRRAANPVSGVTIGGVALDPAASYRITTNNFLADGGDGFPSLTAGTNRTTLPEGVRHRLARAITSSRRCRRARRRSRRRRWIASTSSRRELGAMRRRPCAAAARSGTIGGV